MRNSMGKLAILLLLLAVACTPYPVEQPTPAEPTPTQEVSPFLNPNHELALGECNQVMFTTEQFGREFIWQCVPRGYALYEDVKNNIPIRVVHTGAAYSILPNGARGAIGLSLPTMQLEPGCYAVKAYGNAHMWGVPADYTLVGSWTLQNVAGVVRMGVHNLSANGDYMAVYYLDAPQLGHYTINIYLHLQFASATADSYLTFEAITVEEVSAGHCDGAPDI